MKGLILLLVILTVLTGCAVSPPGLYSIAPVKNVTVPLMLGNPTNPNPHVMRFGSSEAVSVLGLFQFGNAGIYEACRGVGITKIHYVDTRVESFFGIYTSRTTLVYGE